VRHGLRDQKRNAVDLCTVLCRSATHGALRCDTCTHSQLRHELVRHQLFRKEGNTKHRSTQHQTRR